MRPSSGPSILLVEDNPGDVMLIQHCLLHHKVLADLQVLVDGERAMECVQQVETKRGPYPQLVILDLNLPRMTGTMVLSRIRQSPDWNKVPVVVFTSSNSPADREEAVRLGADLYIRKPAGLEEFMDIGKVLKDFLEPGARKQMAAGTEARSMHVGAVFDQEFRTDKRRIAGAWISRYRLA